MVQQVLCQYVKTGAQPGFLRTGEVVGDVFQKGAQIFRFHKKGHWSKKIVIKLRRMQICFCIFAEIFAILMRHSQCGNKVA